jgi:murein DD-endopeptidase MepM/ murein hydrolase activator NlpD
MATSRPLRVLALPVLALALSMPAAPAQEAGGLVLEAGSADAVKVEQASPQGSVSVLAATGDAAVTASAAADAQGAPVNFAALPAASSTRSWRSRGNYAITSRYGYRRNPVSGQYRVHAGVDLAARNGTAILAASPGRVRHAGWRGGYGLLVEVEHAGGLTTRYGHLSRIAVVVGQAIAKGTLIGFVGSTGNSTGPHLHYEVRVGGQAVNPLPPSGK